MLQAAKLGSFKIIYNAMPECQDLVESFIVEANLSTRAFSDSMVCDSSLICSERPTTGLIPNNRIGEYSVLYRHQIFGFGQIVGLYRIFGGFFYQIVDFFFPKTEYFNFWTDKNSFLLICL
jgi:hypothetical protein